MGTTFSFNWYIHVLKHYAQFRGRAKRREYWNFALFNGIIAVFLYLLAIKVSAFMILYIIYALAVLIPGLGVFVRRLHDTNKSGWLILLGLIPIIGAIILFLFVCIGSDDGENKYGEPGPLNPE